jgi:hypothetical protein
MVRGGRLSEDYGSPQRLAFAALDKQVALSRYELLQLRARRQLASS